MESKIIKGLELSQNGQPEQEAINEYMVDLVEFSKNNHKLFDKFMVEKHGKKLARRCDECSNCFNKGYVIDAGMEYYCSDECLHKHYTDKEFKEMYDDGNTETYYTEWECEEDFQYYEDGTEVIEND